MHQAFNFDYLEADWDAAELRKIIDASTAANEIVGAPTTWVLSNHDVVRHVSRLGLAQARPRPNGIRASTTQPDHELGLRRARAATLLMLGAARLGLPLPGRGTGPARPHRARRRPAPGPDLVAVGVHRGRP